MQVLFMLIYPFMYQLFSSCAVKDVVQTSLNVSRRWSWTKKRVWPKVTSKHVQLGFNTSKHVQRCVQTRPIMYEAIVFNFEI